MLPVIIKSDVAESCQGAAVSCLRLHLARASTHRSMVDEPIFRFRALALVAPEFLFDQALKTKRVPV
jgi:hypothetical protein